MIENILNREYVLPKYKRYRPLDLICPCGCEEYVCDRDLISVIIDVLKLILQYLKTHYNELLLIYLL